MRLSPNICPLGWAASRAAAASMYSGNRFTPMRAAKARAEARPSPTRSARSPRRYISSRVEVTTMSTSASSSGSSGAGPSAMSLKCSVRRRRYARSTRVGAALFSAERVSGLPKNALSAALRFS